MRRQIIILSLAALLALPLVALGAMNGPDSGVNSNWTPGQVLAQAVQSQGNQNQGSQSNLLSGVFSGTVEMQGTITGVNRTERTFAINGAWINPSQFRDLARSALGSNVQVTGISMAQALSIWTNMTAGDRFHVRAQLSPGEVRILNWRYESSAQDAARRTELQNRLNALITQVNQLITQLRSMGVLNISPITSSTTSTATSTTSTNP